MMPLVPSKPLLQYRSDIDGLRAIAVLSVVLFHGHVPGFSGGYLGVDVFFVISGFLITGILQTREPSAASLLWFYERRIRRIVPALVLVLAASILAALVILSPFELRAFSRSVISATGFAANFDFMKQGNYFDGGAADLPLQHLWSLAVEEQFYLVYPLALWGLTRLNKKTVWIVIGLVFALSLTYSALIAGKDAQLAFYSPVSRAWELLLGALVALRPLPSTGPKRWSAALSTAALAAILVPVAFYSDKTAWPGLHAAIPCFGTAILLALHGGYRTPVARLLSLRPLAFVGLVSYSLYLWHWPLFTFYGRAVLRSIDTVECAALICASGVLAWLSWRYVERPFRRKNVFKRSTVFRLAGASAAILLAAGLTGYVARGFPARLPPAARIADSRIELLHNPAARAAFHIDTCMITDKKLQYAFSRCFTPARDRPNIVLWGDSTAMQYFPGFDAKAKKDGRNLIQASYFSCRPVPANASTAPGCAAFNRLILSHLNGSIGTVILSAHVASQPEAVIGMRDTARELVRRKIRVIVLGPSPDYIKVVPLYVERFLISGDRSMLDSTSRLRPGLWELDRTMRAAFAGEPGVTYISVLDTVCRDGHCPIETGNIPVHTDRFHLSIEGSNLFAQALWPQIRAAIAAKLTPSVPPVPQGGH